MTFRPTGLAGADPFVCHGAMGSETQSSTQAVVATASECPHRVLWTGGWDSTYRVLQLVLLLEREVLPYYIVDPERRSTEYEQRAMAAIRKRLSREHPEASTRLLETQCSQRGDISPNAEVSAHYRAFVERFGLGSQYEWLALFAEQHDLDGLEIPWERPHRRITGFFRTFLPMLVDVGDGVQALGEDLGGFPEFEVFRRFRFPNLTLSKVEIWRVAERHGLLPLMLLTWFCHRPRKGRPCGRCVPCHYTVKGGLARRMPPRALLRWLLKRTRRYARNPSGGFW